MEEIRALIELYIVYFVSNVDTFGASLDCPPLVLLMNRGDEDHLHG